MMLKKILIFVFAIFCAVILAYLSLPNFSFPKPPPDSLQSQEPADTETPLRRAYFTNYTRAQVLDWYETEFDKSSFLGIKLPTYLLNYPPEDSQTIIRDQTMTSYLEEIVHPFRESFYVNGFEPSQGKDSIFIAGRSWREKIIIRFVPSSVWIRIAVFAGTAAMIVILYEAWTSTVTDLKKIKIKK
jgi:hypothetical protein